MIVLKDIKTKVENIYGVETINKTTIGRDSTKIVDARKLFCKLSKELTTTSFRTIGNFVKIKNHSLIIYYCKLADNHIETDKEFYKNYNNIKNILK